jgi:hypothetical protein
MSLRLIGSEKILADTLRHPAEAAFSVGGYSH